jgi:hypothetical protein
MEISKMGGENQLNLKLRNGIGGGDEKCFEILVFSSLVCEGEQFYFVFCTIVAQIARK